VVRLCGGGGINTSTLMVVGGCVGGWGGAIAWLCSRAHGRLPSTQPIVL